MLVLVQNINTILPLDIDWEKSIEVVKETSLPSFLDITDEYEYYVNNEKCSLYNGIYSATISNPNNIVVKVYLDGVYIGDVKYEKNSSTL